MKKWIVIEKEIGQTPLQALQAFKKWYPGYADVPMAYAGRLDPMASGKLLVLLGDECKKQKAYHALDKTYEFEILIGMQSDSGDVLGLVSGGPVPEINERRLKQILKKLRGPFTLPYPRFSSKTVKGKPLFLWALENKLHDIEIPLQNGYIYSLTLDSLRRVPIGDIYTKALQKIHSLPTVTEESKALGADFRRGDVEDSWHAFAHEHTGQNYWVAKCTCTCSAGTYMRSLAEEVGRQLGTSALAYSIHRNEIGKRIKFPFGFSMWRKRF